jgi:hypothetical protein
VTARKRLNRTQRLAQALAFNCVRNSRLEDIHAEGRISDPEMKRLMIEITDSLYTAMTYPEILAEPPPYWNTPKIDGPWKDLLTWRKKRSTRTST